MNQQSNPITFTLGAVAGILGGFALGIFFGKYALKGAAMVWRSVFHRDDADRRRMKFELLLQ